DLSMELLLNIERTSSELNNSTGSISDQFPPKCWVEIDLPQNRCDLSPGPFPAINIGTPHSCRSATIPYPLEHPAERSFAIRHIRHIFTPLAPPLARPDVHHRRTKTRRLNDPAGTVAHQNRR